MKKLLIIPALLILTGCSGCALKKKQEDNQTPTDPDVNYEIQEETIIHQDTMVTEGVEYGSQQWNAIKSALKERNTEESIEALYNLPQKGDLIYFTTTGNTQFDPYTNTNFSTLNIYSYNLKSQELTRLYSSEEKLVYKTAVIEGNKLILVGFPTSDYATEACGSLWEDNSLTYKFLDLNDTTQLHEYTPSQALIDEEKDQNSKCEKEASIK